MAIEPRTQGLLDSLYAKARPFEPSAFFDREMDQLIYLRSNGSYRADRVDEYLTLLWDAHRPELVGVKLKGFRSIFDELKDKGLVEESYFVPLCKAISMLLHSSMERSAQAEHRAKFYRYAAEVVGDYRFDHRTLLAA